jgi:xylulose-5-phosphate/fructose-6-phosphate phosphoketolase
MAAVSLVRRYAPQIKVRVINVVDVMRLQSADHNPHGLADREFDALFTRDKPIIFAFHGYPSLVHELTYKRTNHGNFHVHGFREEGTTTTPFDMVVLNELDRYHLTLDVVDRLPQLGPRAAYFRQAIRDRLIEHKQYIEQHGEDMPEIVGWQWEYETRGPRRTNGRSRMAASTEGDNV